MERDARLTQTPPGREGPARRVWREARALLRFAAFALANAALALLWFAGTPFTAGSPARRKRWRDSIFRTWARASLACAGVSVVVRGEPPRGPCFLVANHLCYLDIWALASRTGCTFVAQAEIEGWPFFGFMARQLSVVFVERARKRSIPEVNRRVEEALARGHVIAIFPESTTSNGREVKPFRPALLEPAARGGHPAAWAAISYRTAPPDPPASRAVCWSDDTPLPVHARGVLRLDGIEATLTFGPDVVRERDRKVLATELHRRVSEAFEPVE